MGAGQALLVSRFAGCRQVLHIALQLVILPVFTVSSMAVEIEGVHVPEMAVVSDQSLHLNGAGVRTMFFFDIYVGALYLSRLAQQAQQAIENTGPKRVTMYFLHGGIGRKMMVEGWVKGFEKNQTKEAMAKLKSRLDQFDVMFGDVRKGDVYIFDFLPDGSTTIILKGKKKGRITGRDFQLALLAVWLGKHPADKGLKKAMLAQTAGSDF